MDAKGGDLYENGHAFGNVFCNSFGDIFICLPKNMAAPRFNSFDVLWIFEFHDVRYENLRSEHGDWDKSGEKNN